MKMSNNSLWLDDDSGEFDPGSEDDFFGPSGIEIINSLSESNVEVASTPAEQMGIINVAGLIEGLIERNKQFDCNECSTTFEFNEKVSTELFVKNKKNVVPCMSTVKICEISHQVMNDYLNVTHESNFGYYKLFEIIKSKI